MVQCTETYLMQIFSGKELEQAAAGVITEEAFKEIRLKLTSKCPDGSGIARSDEQLLGRMSGIIENLRMKVGRDSNPNKANNANEKQKRIYPSQLKSIRFELEEEVEVEEMKENQQKSGSINYKGQISKSYSHPQSKNGISFDFEDHEEDLSDVEGKMSFSAENEPYRSSRRATTSFHTRKISESAIPVSRSGVIFLEEEQAQIEQKPEEVKSSKSEEEPLRPPGFHMAQRAQSEIHPRNYDSLDSRDSCDRRPSFESQTLMASKHLQSYQLLSLHNLKMKLSKYQGYVDRAFNLINIDTEDAIIEGFGIVSKVLAKAWATPKIGHDLAYGLCDHLRESGYLEMLILSFIYPNTQPNIRLAAVLALEQSCSSRNRKYMVKHELLKPIVQISMDFTRDSLENRGSNLNERIRISISLLESLFKHSAETCMLLIDMGAVDHIITTIKTGKCPQILRHCALAAANLSLYSDRECHQKMKEKQVQDWLFLLASHQDDITRYYACLAICMLVSTKEIESAVIKSGTLGLVEPFLLTHKPGDFARADVKHSQGRPKEWLARLVPMLNGSRPEANSLAAFHFAMEAGIKKCQEKLQMFEEIGAIDALKVVAARPGEVAPKFAQMALKIIGEEVPYKLSQQVPLWSIDDVKYWVKHIGFNSYAEKFEDQMVDGDLLLLLTDSELENDIGMKSGLLRKRFMRELQSLKMLELGIDTNILPVISEETLKSHCSIVNPVHRSKLLQAFQDLSHRDEMEIAIMSRHIEIFVSYRRSTGNQLASLIKVLLQLRGHKVFIDVDRLHAGKFDASLLKNIKAARHFLLVLTPQALDRCVNDDGCEDWVHKEVCCALESRKNIIPIFDPGFEWPNDSMLPSDMRAIRRFNGICWVHEYQEACVDKVEKFIKAEINKSSMGN